MVYEHTFDNREIDNLGLKAWETYDVTCIKTGQKTVAEFPYRDNLGTIIEPPVSIRTSYGWPHCRHCDSMLLPPKPRTPRDDGEPTISWEIASGYTFGYQNRTW